MTDRGSGCFNGLDFISLYLEANRDPGRMSRVPKNRNGSAMFIWEELAFPNQGAPKGAPFFLSVSAHCPHLISLYKWPSMRILYSE